MNYEKAWPLVKSEFIEKMDLTKESDDEEIKELIDEFLVITRGALD